MIRAFLAVIGLIALLAGAAGLWLRLDQPVRVVRVEGAISQAEQDAIREVCSDALTEGVLSIDLEELTARIHDLSWPREVRVRRAWPDGLLIQVTREPLVAAWGSTEFLTSAGKVVRLAGHHEEALPVLSASLATPLETMQTYLLLQEQLRPDGLGITSLVENSLGEWELTLDNGITVALGNRLLSERLQRFLLLYHRVLAERVPEPARVDTRYENGLAVRHGDPAETPVDAPAEGTDGAPGTDTPATTAEPAALLAYGRAATSQPRQPIEPSSRNGLRQ
jgi:cell division protein FtsQ